MLVVRSSCSYGLIRVWIRLMYPFAISTLIDKMVVRLQIRSQARWLQSTTNTQTRPSATSLAATPSTSSSALESPGRSPPSTTRPRATSSLSKRAPSASRWPSSVPVHSSASSRCCCVERPPSAASWVVPSSSSIWRRRSCYYSGCSTWWCHRSRATATSRASKRPWRSASVAAPPGDEVATRRRLTNVLDRRRRSDRFSNLFVNANMHKAAIDVSCIINIPCYTQQCTQKWKRNNEVLVFAVLTFPIVKMSGI